MHVIIVHPKKGKPYFFKKMIGKRAIIGTYDDTQATKMGFVECGEIVIQLSEWIKCEPVLIFN